MNEGISKVIIEHGRTRPLIAYDARSEVLSLAGSSSLLRAVNASLSDAALDILAAHAMSTIDRVLGRDLETCLATVAHLLPTIGC